MLKCKVTSIYLDAHCIRCMLIINHEDGDLDDDDDGGDDYAGGDDDDDIAVGLVL